MAQAYLLEIPYFSEEKCANQMFTKYFKSLVDCVDYLKKIASKEVVFNNDVLNGFLNHNEVPNIFELSEGELEPDIVDLTLDRIRMYETLYPINTLFEKYVKILQVQVSEKYKELTN